MDYDVIEVVGAWLDEKQNCLKAALMIIQLDSQATTAWTTTVAIDDICHTLGAVEYSWPMPKSLESPQGLYRSVGSRLPGCGYGRLRRAAG